MKTCLKCLVELDIKLFGKRKETNDGLDRWCKLCRNSFNKEYRNRASNKVKENIIASRIKYELNNRNSILDKKRNYCKAHKKAKKLYDITYRAINKEKISKYKYNWTKKQLETNIEFKIKRNLRRRIHHVLKGESKSKSTMELIGCTISEFIKHIENQFVDNMSWDNYGKWHIDHIIPCYKFNLNIPEEQAKCFHYSNQRPLWAVDNLSRQRDKLEYSTKDLKS